jgi:hypothetical protein
VTRLGSKNLTVELFGGFISPRLMVPQGGRKYFGIVSHSCHHGKGATQSQSAKLQPPGRQSKFPGASQSSRPASRSFGGGQILRFAIAAIGNFCDSPARRFGKRWKQVLLPPVRRGSLDMSFADYSGGFGGSSLRFKRIVFVRGRI